MTCSKCGSTPDFAPGTCTIYMHTAMDDLFVKMLDLITSKWQVDTVYSNYIQFQVDDFRTFITALNLMPSLTYKESSAIDVLPLYPNQSLDFGTFSKTKPLSKWISLLKCEELIDILNHKRLITYFQPIIDLKNASIYGYELLSRGIKKDGGIMPPFEMFSLAAESDLTFNLDRQARETAIISAARENITEKLFINFLPSVIYNPDVCLKTTIHLINKYHFKPENIAFEVVETEEIRDTNHLSNILDFYRARGFKIALDDLGSGYSSLNNLSKLHPNYMKVDIEIIRNIHEDSFKQAVFEALVLMAKKTGIKVLAEGIETKAELDYVASRGADFAQGYYFAKPSPKPIKTLTLTH